MSFSSLLKVAGKTIGAHGPAILMGLGAIGVCVGVYRGIKDSKKAEERIEKAIEKKAEEQGVDPEEVELTKMETVKAVAPAFISTALTIGMSLACFFGAHSIDVQRNATMIALYTATNEAAKQFEDKTQDIAGEKMVEKIKAAVVEDKAETAAKPITDPLAVFSTGAGDYLCLDAWNGRYFRSRQEKVRQAIAEANLELRSTDYVSVNEFWDKIGLEACEGGSQLGWNIYDNNEIDPEITTIMAPDPFNEPCMVISLNPVPRPNYWIHG